MLRAVVHLLCPHKRWWSGMQPFAHCRVPPSPPPRNYEWPSCICSFGLLLLLPPESKIGKRVCAAPNIPCFCLPLQGSPESRNGGWVGGQKRKLTPLFSCLSLLPLNGLLCSLTVNQLHWGEFSGEQETLCRWPRLGSRIINIYIS